MTYYSVLLTLTVWFVIMVVIHELGHYIMFRFYKIRPRFKLTWWGIEIGEQKDLNILTPYKACVVAWAGIFTGLVYTWIVAEKYILFYLILLCFIDFFMIFSCFKFKFKDDNSYNYYTLKFYEKEITELNKVIKND